MNPIILSTIVLSYNTADLTFQTLTSLQADIMNTPVLKDASEVIVVDNHSRDSSIAQLNQFKKQAQAAKLPVKLILNPKNVGFPAGCNQGLEVARGQYLLLLNSDTIVQPGALQKMVEAFEAAKPASLASPASSLPSEQLGILAATLLNPDGTNQPQGGDLPSLWSLFFMMTMMDDWPIIGKWLPSIQRDGASKNRWVAGTAMMISREAFQTIGPLDQTIFMYAEDVEYCLRAHNHHFYSAIHPTALITHLKAQSADSPNPLIGEFKGLQIIWSKHFPLWQQPMAKLLLQIGAILRIFVFSLVKNNPVKVKAYTTILNNLLSS